MTAQSAAANQTESPLTYESRFSATLAQVNARLTEYLTPNLSERFEGPQGLWEALRYGTLDGGKRIRAVIAVESCLACGGDLETVLPTACAIELVHAQSLIHDDLPCMDDDDLRRGKPSLHKAFNESTAVLAGDALLAMAFGLVSRHTPRKAIAPESLLDLISEFADVTSVYGLVSGQYVDILYEAKPYTPEILEYIHAYKTGALFCFSFRAGARLGGASGTVLEQFTRIGEKLGLAFQIVDDLLDIASTPETLGKTVGKDLAQQKATYPALHGEAASRTMVASLVSETHAILDAMPTVRTEGLRALAEFIRCRIH